MIKRTIALAIMSVFLTTTQAQTPPATPVVVDVNSPEFKQKVEEARGATAPLNVTVETVGSSLSVAERMRLEDLANQITDKTMQRFNSDEARQYEATALQMKRRADDIADEALAGSRDTVLKFLGIDPKSKSNLYYFVSFSMPVEMIRSYVLEAMWSGATIVVRGVPRGRSIKAFFTEDLRQLIYGKGASANISLDPRLFEIYDVQTVPTIVYTEDRGQPRCDGQQSQKFKTGDKDLSFETCAKYDNSKYWKISGAVTSGYALQAFVDQGAAGAAVYRDALRKGLSQGTDAPKSQQAFSGSWKDAVSPDDLLAEKQAIDAARLKAQTGSSSTEPLPK